ncbi:transcription-repair coupling factor (superfamily II helicase) [Clostridium acetobutylicum]|uniref:Transcription-repair-coupling factor n=2 Tax=Bacteria TaxID=2 RepID=Q97E98_CLOAB|nr:MULTISPECIES: transcription-repair coupling factor [Clostridium]AAK81152.1 Transcription-repair coupling factor, MFD (superfamily II helicase) [Clostridium acetobutylicum ATCC 824]ADZ22257.1 Transcription-repair coupling factor, MFD (superfamily II helicase) [Clostridium acetobutylicum EA 2018]AEI33533.1 transcription-repair coupling factor [Clostridium acetobutylicum DSM 1731]AWV81179.1 transcription-repair coupling factor [Clostridium acetobutylicum]MBC2395618.1 transcription-repair coupl
MRLDGLMHPLKGSNKFQDAIYKIKSNEFPMELSGISESGKSYLISGLYEELDNPFLVITDSDSEAKKIYEDLLFYTQSVYYLPTKEVVFYNIYAVSGDLRWERLKVIRKMMSRGKKIIVTSVENLAAVYLPVELYKEYTFKLTLGDTVEAKELQKKLVQCGYEHVESVDAKGQFSIRGGIVDIYSPIDDVPYRIEFFGDEIESIRSFNTESQRSIEKVNKIEVFPAKEIILTDEALNKGYEAIKDELNQSLDRLKGNNEESYNKLKETMEYNLEALKERAGFETIDTFIPYFYDNTSSFFDYLKNSIIFVDNYERCKGKIDSVYCEFEQNYENFLERGDILPKQGNIIVSKENIYEILKTEKRINLESIGRAANNNFRTGIAFEEITLSSYQGQMDLLINDIKELKEEKYRTVILCGTKSKGQRLVETLGDRGIESVYKDSILNVDYGEVVISPGSQLRGFRYPEIRLCVISDKEIFGTAKKKKEKRKNKKGVGKIKSFTELKPGDYIVHVNHGIGVFKGIKQLEVQGHKKDYLELSYAVDDKLYVPVEQLDLVQKYIGSEGKVPKVNKLGSSEWTKAKNKVRKSINEIAEELVKLYAVRTTVNGFKYSKDTVWQKQFEEEFPYNETQDQLLAIDEIKNDMESGKVMDRLICGDVGYGKTEVAIRAAFKTVMDGKQVAFLVPTTILAEQHYNNFKKRFKDFPVEVDMVSRFRSQAQQKATFKALKEGNIDIIIGTHRILNKEITFKDLGLLIIDEEQRFGVSHKEKLKKFKKNIDVLTLSATPIPRTLHMSLTGVRDISVIETPPEERYPVQTYVVEYNDQLIRDAIMREIGRDGQVFFVYNKVESIKEMAANLGKLIPEARIAIAHGQMSERELEKVMIDFMEGNYDILLCTTIIETGIDIQNVNTLIIYNADKMGLSQLYQLRGRVGRTNRMAYAYFTYKKDKILTEVAEKRLKAIKEFTQLGSGFKIAMRDLEIRGAGNIMGSAQHGHMATIGYDLYCRMLEDTIKEIKGEIQNEPVETTVDLKVDAYIPSLYIEDETLKISIYKKIAAIDSYEEMMDVKEELEDRFSSIPQSVNNLMTIAYLRSIGRQLGILEIKDKMTQLEIKFESNDRVNKKLINGLLKNYSKSILFKMGDNPVILYNLKDVKREDMLENLQKFLKYMKSLVETN